MLILVREIKGVLEVGGRIKECRCTVSNNSPPWSKMNETEFVSGKTVFPWERQHGESRDTRSLNVEAVHSLLRVVS